MYIKRITLTGFKSYKSTAIELGPGLNIIGASRTRCVLVVRAAFVVACLLRRMRAVHSSSTSSLSAAPHARKGAGRLRRLPFCVVPRAFPHPNAARPPCAVGRNGSGKSNFFDGAVMAACAAVP